MKTVNDLFILDGMKDSKVIAGHRGLSRSVQSVNISDTPDIIKFLNEGDILLTTAYAFKNDPQKLCNLITEMNAINCAGIVIKMERFLVNLPEEVKLHADHLSFPIIDLPLSYTLGEVSHYILNYLNNHKIEQLYYAMHIHKKFSDMMIKGYSLPALVEQVRYFLKRPVLLLNHRGEPIALSHDFREGELKQLEPEILRKIKGQLPAARKGDTFSIQPDKGQMLTTYPVQTKRQHDSILVILDAQSLPYPASQLAIEQACNVISFTLVKQQAIEENARLYKVNFFADFIEGRIDSEQEILNRCDYYGLKADMNTACIICRVDTEKENRASIDERAIEETHNMIYEQLEDEIINGHMKGMLFTKEKFFVLLLQFKEDSEAEMDRLLKFLEQAQKNFQEMGLSVSFGVSKQVKTLYDIPTAYQEAVEAIHNGDELNLTNFIKLHKTRELKELLAMIPEKNLKEFYQNTLKTLAYPKTKEDQELLKTLHVYLDCQCEISETSRKMYIHRNTVKYRIEKAEKIMGCTFQDPSDSLRIRTALLIRPALDASVRGA